MRNRTCANCKHLNSITSECDIKGWDCDPEHYIGWLLKDDQSTKIDGVAEEETVSNEQGGKQSRLDYRFDLIDPKSMFALARVMHEGAQKYEKDNWRKISIEEHLNHALSHIYAHLAGDNQDAHLDHALTRLSMAIGVRNDNM